MKKLHALIALSFGILATSSGVHQVQAASRFFFVDYATKEVANFTPYRQSFNDATTSLTNSFKWTFSAQYKFDSCVGITTDLNAGFAAVFRRNTAPTFTTISQALPDLPCTTTFTNYSIEVVGIFNTSVLESIVDDDGLFLDIRPVFTIFHSPAYSSRILDFINVVFAFDFYYDFNTTYLFNTFLSDSQLAFFNGTNFTFPTNTFETFLEYVYTQAGNDIDTIYNDPGPASIGFARKKYAIDFPDVFFRGERIGLRYAYLRPDMRRILPATGITEAFPGINYHYFNVSNYQQPIVNVPLINFTTQSCSGGFLDINVGCFINNGLAYLTNTAPIISDATQLINAGISFAGQTFGIIGAFSTNNMFGYLILGGFGFIVIKSLFKNDK
jgi:hypothetical protein